MAQVWCEILGPLEDPFDRIYIPSIPLSRGSRLPRPRNARMQTALDRRTYADSSRVWGMLDSRFSKKEKSSSLRATSEFTARKLPPLNLTFALRRTATRPGDDNICSRHSAVPGQSSVGKARLDDAKYVLYFSGAHDRLRAGVCA